MQKAISYGRKEYTPAGLSERGGRWESLSSAAVEAVLSVSEDFFRKYGFIPEKEGKKVGDDVGSR